MPLLEPITSPKQRLYFLPSSIKQPIHIRQRFKRRIAILMMTRLVVRFRDDRRLNGLSKDWVLYL